MHSPRTLVHFGPVVGPFLVHLCRFTTQVVTSERHVRRRGGTEGGCGGAVSGAELANNRTDVSSELMGVELVVGH